ncbi:MAG: NUDIX domain-containing protein [Paracoccaceae bacterium]
MGRKALVLTSVQSLFLYGTLRHLPLLRLVMGNLEHLQISEAVLPDHAVYWVVGESFPVVVKVPGQSAPGLLVQGLNHTDIARLDFYEGAYDYVLQDVEVRVGETLHSTQVYVTGEDRWPIGKPWSLQGWVRDWAPVVLMAADEMMEDFGLAEAHDVARRYPQIMQRAASRLRAGKMPTPKSLRQGPDRGKVRVERQRRPYSNYFALEEMDLTFPQFDGGTSDLVTRAAFVSGDAVTVLPYDPARDRVMVIEQFRFGPFLRGDLHPWSLEPIAGRIDPGETPEAAARRELDEEAAIRVGDLLPVARYYPSPGAMTEYLFSYIGIADLPDDAEGLGGVASEAEDIRSHLLSFAQLMQLVGSGEAENGPLVLSALWLAGRRDVIRQGA